MTYQWVSAQAGADVTRETGLDQSFHTRADAEAWLSSCYDELAEAGVDEVTLFQDDHVVYGPMSLHP